MFKCLIRTLFFMILSFIPATSLYSYVEPCDRIANPEELDFLIRIDSLIQIIENESEKKFEKMSMNIIKLKNEIEIYRNISINIKKTVNLVVTKTSKCGKTIPPQYVQAFKDKLKRKLNQFNRHTSYISYIMHLDNCQFNSEEEDFIFPEIEAMVESNKIIKIPYELSYGMILSMIGIWLDDIPLPICKIWAERISESGFVNVKNYLFSTRKVTPI